MEASLPAIPPDEGLHEVDQIRNVLGVDEDQNIAYAELTVDGEHDELVAVSGRDSSVGTVPSPAQRSFETFDIGFDRSWDAEVKLLEQIALLLREANYSTAEIRVFTERQPCDSCQGVIAQFRSEFPPPGVQLSVSHAER